MSDGTHKFHISAAGVGEMLTGGGEFLPPGRLLGDLTEAQALAALPGSAYSIAQIVAHMHYWQDRNIARARGAKPPRPEHLDDTFPVPQVGEWEALRTAFLGGLDVCAQVAAEKAGLSPTATTPASAMTWQNAPRCTVRTITARSRCYVKSRDCGRRRVGTTRGSFCRNEL
jgi:hypothetical protein